VVCDPVVLRELEKQLGNRKVRRGGDIRIVFAGTDKLKDEVTAALVRKAAGPGKFHLPEELPDAIIDEFCAEQRLPKGWEPKKSGLRNEALDHAVYGKALVIVIGGEKIDWSSPPEWARAPEANSYGVRATVSGTAEPVAPAVATRGRRMRSRGI